MIVSESLKFGRGIIVINGFDQNRSFKKGQILSCGTNEDWRLFKIMRPVRVDKKGVLKVKVMEIKAKMVKISKAKMSESKRQSIMDSRTHRTYVRKPKSLISKEQSRQPEAG